MFGELGALGSKVLRGVGGSGAPRRLVFRLTGLPQTMCTAVLISASAPVGVNVAVYAQLHDLDYAYASETVVLSTLLSVVFQPLVLMLAASL